MFEPRVIVRDREGGLREYRRPVRVITAERLDEVVNCLAEARREADSGRVAVGFVSYGAAPAFDSALRAAHPEGLPYAWFGVFEGEGREVSLDSGPAGAESKDGVLEWRSELSETEYREGIERIREALAGGESYQVNYTQRFRARFEGDAKALFTQLYRSQPGKYSAFVDTGRFAILSTSPELFFETEGRAITSKPMKGTAPRGRWREEDEARREGLLASVKERAENVMIVDLVRSDLGRIAKAGTVRVPGLFEAVRLPTVWQMTSTVEAELRDDAQVEDVFAAAFPPGSVTGAPKPKTMAIIDDLEKSPRGVYCGAIGIMGPGRRAVFNVAIRTVVIDRGAGEAECGLGGGITWDSTPDAEYAEVRNKARFLGGPPRTFDLLETMRLEGGRIFLLERHLQRLRQSAEWFGFRYDEVMARARLDALAETLPAPAHRVRLLVSRSGHVCVEATPLSDAMDWSAWSARLAEDPADESDPFLCHKTTNRAVYDRHRAGLSADEEVLLWNRDGNVTEFTLGNLVYELGGRLGTPPRESGLLNGTMRDALLARGAILERVLTLDELPKCAGIWHVNSVRGMTRVGLSGKPGIDPRPVPPELESMEGAA